MQHFVAAERDVERVGELQARCRPAVRELHHVSDAAHQELLAASGSRSGRVFARTVFPRRTVFPTHNGALVLEAVFRGQSAFILIALLITAGSGLAAVRFAARQSDRPALVGLWVSSVISVLCLTLWSAGALRSLATAPST